MRQELRIYAAVSVVLGLIWLSETTVHQVWPHLELPLMAAICGICLFQIRPLRALPKGRAKPPHVLSAAALILPAIAVVMFVRAVAPTVSEAVADVALHDRTIDDLTIALPRGDEKSESGAMSNLRIHRAGGLDLSVGLLWTTGEFDEGAAQEFVDRIAGKLGAPRPVALPDTLTVGGGLPQRSFRFEASGSPMMVTMFPCGAQVYAVMVGGPGAPGLAPRLLASVRCRAH